jgi:hypothetical protein
MRRYEQIDGLYLLGRVKTPMPQVVAHQTVVFLFHHAVIVFLIGTAAAQLHSDHFVFPEVHQMGIEELDSHYQDAVLAPQRAPAPGRDGSLFP